MQMQIHRKGNAMEIILKGGPLDGLINRVPKECLIYRKGNRGLDTGYKDSGVDDGNGHRVFEHAPRKADPTE